MTNREALTAALQVEFPDASIELALINSGLDGTAVYAQGNKGAVNLMALDLLRGLLTTPDITEGGMSIKYDRNAVLKRVASLEVTTETIPVAAIPKVRSPRVW
jgi:hypothetical protein